MCKVSIIIRSKNEERWIGSCLDAIFKQRYQNFEVILVDNNSNDKTLSKAQPYDIKIIEEDSVPFLPGQAINKGIAAASGEFVAIISAHCIPVNEFWLENLLKNFDDETVAGVYGRQEPLSFTNYLDKRDLINIFGLDRKVQRKDPFFHNANSLIRRKVWEELPFDEETLHIEDRIWAKEILGRGYTIVYEPEASVYHYHGINQGRNVSRAKGVVRILESIHDQSTEFSLEGLNITAIIPSRGKSLPINGVSTVERTIKCAKKSRLLSNIVVATDNERTVDLANKTNVSAILRPQRLSLPYISLIQVYQYVLDELAVAGNHPDLLVLLEEKYPFRVGSLIDRMIEGLLHGGYDSVIAATKEFGSLWKPDGDSLVRVDEGMVPSRIKNPLFKGILGLGCVTHPEVIQNGGKLGERVGIIEVDNDIMGFSVKDDMDYMIAELIDSKNKTNKKDSL